MIIEDINNLKMEVYNLTSMVGMLQFMFYEVINSEEFDKILVFQCEKINSQIELIKGLNNEIREVKWCLPLKLEFLLQN